MLKTLIGLFLFAAASLSAQVHPYQINNFSNFEEEAPNAKPAARESYLFESYSINIHPVTLIKGYMPITIEMRLTQKLSIETGPALVTRPYLYAFPDAKPVIGTDVYEFSNNGVGSYLGEGEANYNLNLGWETAIKFYFDRDIWESAYFALFHSYRHTTADLVNLPAGLEDIEDYGFYTRNHVGFKFGKRSFLDERISAAGDNWVVDTYLGLSYAGISSQNFTNTGSNQDDDFAWTRTVFLHYGISIGFLKE